VTEPLVDPIGPLIIEARAVSEIAAIVGARVRGFEPHGATDSYEGDALGPGKYKAFLVLFALSIPPDFRVPIIRAEIGFRAYGRTLEEAMALYGAVVAGFHRRKHRIASDGLGIYRTSVTGGEQSKDPSTDQPLVTGTIELLATSQAVAV
jgi:hypothetical protein